MRQVVLPETDLSVSRAAFGTARIHRLPSLADQHRLLEQAVDSGFTHFDTAPLYGYGAAERALAVLARRAEISIATKVGLYPPGGAGRSSRAAMLARKIGGKLVPSLSRARVSADVVQAEASLTDSLRRLMRERADILFIHEPDPALFQTDEWEMWREREALRGRARWFGLAGDPKALGGWAVSRSGWTSILQTRDDGAAADPLRGQGRPPQLTYGLLAQGDELARGLARNPAGAVIVSSRDPARLAERIRASEQGPC